MAANIARSVALQSKRAVLQPFKLFSSYSFPVRTIITKESGALLPKPAQVRFGLIKVTLTVTPFLMTGAMISREFATLLEEHELFVPDDDDDD